MSPLLFQLFCFAAASMPSAPGWRSARAAGVLAWSPPYDAAFSFGTAPGFGLPILTSASVRTSFRPSAAS